MALGEPIQIGSRGCELVGQRLPLGAQAGEEKAAITGHSRHAGQALAGREQRLVVPPTIRDADQIAAIVVGPAVVSAAEDAGIAALLEADHGPLMAAAIEQDVVLAFGGIAGHDDRLAAPGKSS